MIVLAPSTVQEAVDMTYEAFDLAARDNNPVLILTDGVLGTMMEPVVLPEMKSQEEVAEMKAARRSISAVGHMPSEQVRILPGGIGDGWEKTNIETAKLYKTWDKDISCLLYTSVLLLRMVQSTFRTKIGNITLGGNAGSAEENNISAFINHFF